MTQNYFDVIVNGAVHRTRRFVGYREIVALAHFDCERVLTVTYRAAQYDRSGSLKPDSGPFYVEVRDGTVFNVADTSNA